MASRSSSGHQRAHVRRQRLGQHRDGPVGQVDAAAPPARPRCRAGCPRARSARRRPPPPTAGCRRPGRGSTATASSKSRAVSGSMVRKGTWRRSTRSLRSLGRTSAGTWLAARDHLGAGTPRRRRRQARIFSTSVRGIVGVAQHLQHRHLHGVLGVLGIAGDLRHHRLPGPGAVGAAPQHHRAGDARVVGHQVDVLARALDLPGDLPAPALEHLADPALEAAARPPTTPPPPGRRPWPRPRAAGAHVDVFGAGRREPRTRSRRGGP